VRGDVKLFDFGLSFEITEECASVDGLYELSGNTGSMRYMAPEVALGHPYNHKVDVYSFAILFWQVSLGSVSSFLSACKRILNIL